MDKLNISTTVRVSFCMTSYKRPETLQKTLNSLYLQTFPHFEVIVSDNDPECTARAIVESIKDARFKYFANGENLGMIKSFNKSIERSSGEFIVMIADDDPVYPDMLEVLFELHKLHPGYGMYLGGCDWRCTSPAIGKLYHFRVGTNSCLSDEHEMDYVKAYTAEEFLKSLFSLTIFRHYLWSTCMVRREVLIEKGCVPHYGTPFLGDYAYIAIMASHSGCVIINRALGYQTLHKENFGRNQNEQIAIAVKKFPDYIEKRASHLPNWPEIKKMMLRFTGLWAFSHLSFLYHYYKQAGISVASFKQAEKEVFSIPYVKKFKIKYFLKKRFPFVHDILVKLKKKMG